MGNRSLIIVPIVLALSIASPSILNAAGGCPAEPGWNYTTNGPDTWGTLFPVVCGLGVRQSPVNIDPSTVAGQRTQVRWHQHRRCITRSSALSLAPGLLWVGHAYVVLGGGSFVALAEDLQNALN